MSLLIKNGTIVPSDRTFLGDLLCERETIAAIGPNLVVPAGAEVVDATGK